MRVVHRLLEALKAIFTYPVCYHEVLETASKIELSYRRTTIILSQSGALERVAETPALSEGSPEVRANSAPLNSQGFFDAYPYRSNDTAATYTPTTIQSLLAEYYECVDVGSQAYCDLIKSLGVDTITLRAGAGICGICRLKYLPDRSFEFDDSGLPSVVVEALDTDAETVVDLVAWPVHRPDKFAPALRRVRGLGINMVENPATYFGGRPLKVFRTPLAWMEAGCDGVVVVDPRFVFSWLGEALGTIAGEDLEHAREIARALHPYVDPSRILAPIDEAAA